MRERGSDTGSYRNLFFHPEPQDSRPKNINDAIPVAHQLNENTVQLREQINNVEARNLQAIIVQLDLYVRLKPQNDVGEFCKADIAR